MQAQENNLRKLLESNAQQYMVPLFQRFYVWQKPAWQRLWDDLTELLEDADAQHTHYVAERCEGFNEQEITLGMVTERYEPLQNEEAFSFFDPIINQKTATFETAGALGVGERVWVLAKMPEVIEVVRGDDCNKYLLLSNTHSGQGSVTVKFTAIRVVCQNTLLWALKDGQQAFRVRHSRRMSDRLSEVSALIAAVNAAYAQAAQAFAQLAKTPIKNAVTRFEDYRQVRDEIPSKRLERVWFGRGADLKVNALNEALRLAA